MGDDWESKGEKNEPACINWLNSEHSGWKSQKKSHSTLRAKRATFTFSLGKSRSILASFWKMRHFWEFSATVSKVGWGWDVPKPICWLLSPHQLARWVDGIYAEMQCYQKLQQKCSVLEHQSFCLTSCIFILSEQRTFNVFTVHWSSFIPLVCKTIMITIRKPIRS